jgi:hypothetical protein
MSKVGNTDEKENQESMNQGLDEWTKTKASTPFRKTFHVELFFHLARRKRTAGLVPTPHKETLPLLEVESLTSMTRYAMVSTISPRSCFGKLSDVALTIQLSTTEVSVG